MALVVTSCSTVKDLSFMKKNKKLNYSSVELVILEFKSMDIGNIIAKIVEAGKLQITGNGLLLKEYKVTDYGETTITVTIYQDLRNSMDINKIHELTNLQIATDKNEKDLSNNSN